MAGGKGNIDAISVSLGADLKQLRTDLRAAKSELDKALPTTRNVHVSVNITTPNNAVTDLYQNIRGQFDSIQKGQGQNALRIAPRMTVDPRVMRDFRRDIERNMMQAARSGQGIKVPIRFNGDVKAFVASIGHIEVPVYGRFAGWSPGGGPPEGGMGGGGGGGGGPAGPGPGARSRNPPPTAGPAPGPRGPAGGGAAPKPARGKPAGGGAKATGGVVVPPHVYATETRSSDVYQTEAPPTPRQQRQQQRRAAMSGATPPRPGLTIPGRGVATRPTDPVYDAPPGGRVDMASVRGGSSETELQGEERAAYIAQQRETRSRRNFEPNTARQVRSGGRPTTPKAIERLARRRRYQAGVARGQSPADLAAREHIRSGFHTLDPDLAAAYDIINDPESTLSFDQFLESAERTREAYGTAFHGGLQVTDKGIRRTGQAKKIGKQRRVARGFAKGDLNQVPPEVLLFDAALDAARDLQMRMTDPNYSVRTGDQKRRGRGGKVGQAGGRNAGMVASETIDPSRVSEILARRAVGGPGNGWETLKKEGYSAAEISVARSRIGANNPKVVSNKDPRAPGLANVTLDEETLEGGVRTRHFTHIGPEAPALTAAGGQGMFRAEPTPDRPQPRDFDRPGIDPASLIGGGGSDTSRYGGRKGRGPFQKWMDRQRDLQLARNQSAARFKFAEGGWLEHLVGGGVSARDLRAFFGKRMPEKTPRPGSRARLSLEEQFRTGKRARELRSAKPKYQQGGGSDPRWRALADAQFEKDPFCIYCGKKTVRGAGGAANAFRGDHARDVASGGEMYDPENIVTACNSCNSFKSGGKSARPLYPGQRMKLLGPGKLAEGGGMDLPEIGSLAQARAIAEQHGTQLYTRWSPDLRKDMTPGRKSHVLSGRSEEPGISALPLELDQPHLGINSYYDLGGKKSHRRGLFGFGRHKKFAPRELYLMAGDVAGEGRSWEPTLHAKSILPLGRFSRDAVEEAESLNPWGRTDKRFARARGLAEGGGVKWTGLASSRGGIKSATMVGERGPEIMVEGHNGKAEVIPSHKVAGFMDGMAEGGAAYPYGRGIRMTGPGAGGATLGARMAGAAGAAVGAGSASSTMGSILRVFVTNWPTGFGAGAAAAGAAHGAPAAGHAAAPGAPPAGPGAPPAPGPGAVPGAPATGAGRARRGVIDPYARVRAEEVARAGEEREGSRASRIVEAKAEATDVAQRIPVRATSVSFGQIAQQGLGGRGDILARQRRANVAIARAQRAEATYTNLRQTGAEMRTGISDITSGRRAFDTTADRDATLAQMREQYSANVRARREAGQVAETRLGQAEAKQAGVLTRGQQFRSQAAGLGGIIAGTAVFSTAITAFSTAAQAAQAALDPLVQSMLGWTAAIDKVTASVRDSIMAAGGNVRAGVAGALAPSGITARYLDQAGGNLTRTGTYRAAAAAGAERQDITRAALGPAKGLYEGTGGFLGGNILTELFGGQPGALQTVAGRLEAPNRIPEPDLTRTNPVAYLMDKWVGTNISGAPMRSATADEDTQFIVDELNTNLKDAATFAGDAAGGFQLVTKATQEQRDAMIASAATISQEAKTRAEQLSNIGIAVTRPGGQALDRNSQEFGQYGEQQARGLLIQDPAMLLRATEPARRARAFATQAQGMFTRGEDIPASFAMQQIAQPLGRIGAGYDQSNLSAQARKSQADAAKATTSIADSTARGVAAMENIVSRIDNPSFYGGLGTSGEGPQKGATGGRVGPALTAFRGLVGQIGGLGTQIQGKVDMVAQEQATLQAHEYSEQLRLANQSLTDAQDLWGGIQGEQKDTLGGLQGQNILLDRQNQLLSRRQQRLSFKSEDIGFKTSDLQIRAQNLGFQQSQRQINFQTAIAGFAAPGSTPEERAARINEAKLEAEFAQKQLDLQIQIAEQGRQQLKIAKEQSKLGRQQFGNQVQQQENQFAITAEEAKRSVETIQNSLNLLMEGHTVTIDTAAAEEAIGRLQKEQGILVDQARAYVSEGQEVRTGVLEDIAKLMTETGKGFNELVSNVEGAWNEAFKASYENYLKPLTTYLNQLGSGTGTTYNSGGDRGDSLATGAGGQSRYGADGFLGTTAGPTQFIAGEAGREHVVVLRNATQGTMQMGLGGGGGTNISVGGVTIVVSGTKDMDEAKLADIVVERMARKLAMLGAA